MINSDNLPAWKQNLVSGYHEFRKGTYRKQKEEYSQLGTEGQYPKTMVITCADSRINPTAIFNAHPGELFSLRNVANIVPPFDDQNGVHGASATIEYAVVVLQVDAVVVMGHESCGGIAAYLDGLGKTDETEFIGPWISLLDKAYERLDPAFKADGACATTCQTEMEFSGVLQSLDNLMTFPFVEAAVKDGKLSLLGSYFSIIQGKLMFADETGRFKEVPTRA